MKTPNDQSYNINHNNEIKFNTFNIDQLIMVLNEAKKRLGGEALVMISFDSGAGYEEINSIHAEDFHDNLVLTISGAKLDEIKYKCLEYYGGIGRRFNDYPVRE